jgi:ComF family protein
LALAISTPLLPASDWLVSGGPRRALHAVRRGVLDLLLPPQCATCDALVDEPGQFCSACFRSTGFVSAPNCATCGVPFANAAQGGPMGICPNCQAHPPVFDRARAALRYDAQARRIILSLKHADRIENARVLAPLMARAGAALLDEADMLVPVPLHRRRLLARKFNQAALLAQVVGRIARRAVLVDGLRRVLATPPLGERGAAARAETMSGAIATNPRRAAEFRGAHVLVVDDVMTSGATANECATALKGAGAATVSVLVAARVPDPRLS